MAFKLADESTVPSGIACYTKLVHNKGDFIVTRDTLLDVMYTDAYQRRTGRVPLYDIRLLDVMSHLVALDIEDCMIIHHTKHFGHSACWSDVEREARHYSRGNGIPRVIDSATTNLIRKFPHVNSILELFPKRLIVAGGAILRAIRRNTTTSDIDFFFLEGERQDYQTEINEMMNTIISFFSQGEEAFKVFKSGRTVTILTLGYPKEDDLDSSSESDGYVFEPKVRTVKYQFITGRMYARPEDVVRGFDIAPCQCLYDGDNIFTTSLGFFSLLTGLIIVDPSRRSTTYESRLRKYMSIGHCMCLVFPTINPIDVIRLDRSRNPDAYYGDHIITVEPVKGLRCCYGTMDTRNKFLLAFNDGKNASEINDTTSDYAAEFDSIIGIERANTMMAVRGSYHSILWEIKESAFEPPCPVFDIDPRFGVPSSSDHTIRPADITIKQVASWLPSEQVKELWAAELEANPISNGTLTYMRREVQQRVIQVANEAVEKAKEFLSKPENFEFYGPRDNPGRQYTSSFNPLPADLRNYYHRAAKVVRMGLSHEVYFLCKTLFKSHGIGKDVLNLLCYFLVEDRLNVFKPIEDARRNVAQLEDISIAMIGLESGISKFSESKPFCRTPPRNFFDGFVLKLNPLLRKGIQNTGIHDLATAKRLETEAIKMHWPAAEIGIPEEDEDAVLFRDLVPRELPPREFLELNQRMMQRYDSLNDELHDIIDATVIHEDGIAVRVPRIDLTPEEQERVNAIRIMMQALIEGMTKVDVQDEDE